ncbi:hypothetical protein KQX54_004690 [Cotesia glomerata]|uniref:Uncharacterized protein n=1 Tax=Cotesia glomerata TaxID=32391 RepID=A0AAV7J4T8_COTGL|nr:hypothetical protein KQX54_004690 [Cotesia glomerata]
MKRIDVNEVPVLQKMKMQQAFQHLSVFADNTGRRGGGTSGYLEAMGQKSPETKVKNVKPFGNETRNNGFQCRVIHGPGALPAFALRNCAMALMRPAAISLVYAT